MTDPRPIIMAFLEGLPNTIRTHVLFPVIVFAVHETPPSDSQEFVGVIRDYLESEDRGYEVGAAWCVTAVIGHIIEKSVTDGTTNEAVMKRLAATFPEAQQSLPHMSLMQKHYGQALVRWRELRSRELRSRELSDQTLRDFVDILGKESDPKRPHDAPCPIPYSHPHVHSPMSTT